MKLPQIWSLPNEIKVRFGQKRSGRQRAMAADGHLLLVLHRVPTPDSRERDAIYFWRKPDGHWEYSGKESGLRRLREHIEEYDVAAEEFNREYEQAQTATDYFQVLERVAPLHHAAKNLYATLQAAREAIPLDRDIIDLRDWAYDLERTLDLLYMDTKNALDFHIAKQTEAQAGLSMQAVKVANRLNLLAAIFFPLTAIASVFGMNLSSGIAGDSVEAFCAILLVGVMLGFVTSWWALEEHTLKIPSEEIMTSISRKMADFALGLQYDDIPSDAVHEAKRFLLDSIGCALAALYNEDMQAAHHYVVDLGGKAEATVIGTGFRTHAANAALMNALLVRAIDYNDIYWENDPSHPSDIIPAGLACGERANKDGRDAVVAIVIGHELEMRWCHAATPGVREVGWHHASLTQFVSPLVAGRMLDLTPDQMVAATGISGSSHFTLGGVVAGHLTNMKNTADPMATEAGVRAALLAMQGYGGPVEVIEGKEGLIEVLNNVEWSTGEMLKGLGEEYLITRCGYKAFPTEALTHQPITAVLHIVNQHDIAAEDVAEVLVKTTTRGADILSDPSKYKPTTKETADHSLPYCIAAAVADRAVLPSSFDDEKLQDPRIWDLLPKIQVVADSQIDALFPKVKRAICSITTNAGETHSYQTDTAKGRPGDPMNDDELVAKFKANSQVVMSEAHMERVVQATWELEKHSIADYMELLKADR